MASPYLRPFVRMRQAELNDTFDAARRTYPLVKYFFQVNARSIIFQKVIGFGGSGMVTLWTELDRAYQRVQDLAVKAPVDGNDPYFRMELQWMLDTFATSEHFVQLIWPSQDVLEDIYNSPDLNDESAALMIMEYFERCELNELLVRVNESVTNNATLPNHEKKLEFLPSRVLWRLFFCLVRSCIGMAYPPPLYDDDRDRSEVYREVVQPGEDPRPIIHFDIHPLNVYIDNPFPTVDDLPEHGLVPRFKLADFGLMTEWDEGWSKDEKYSVVNVGKPGYQAPEQRDRQRPLEVNAFGPHTNIWAVGLLMYNALTLYFTEDEDWQPRVCQITMLDGTVRDLNTWAPYLVGNPVYDEFKAYSIELRTLIARCMADDRQDRPTLDELLQTIQQAIARDDAAAREAQARWNEEKRKDPTKQKPPVDSKRPPAVEDDDLLLRFFREYFREPPVRGDPYRDYWE